MVKTEHCDGVLDGFLYIMRSTGVYGDITFLFKGQGSILDHFKIWIMSTDHKVFSEGFSWTRVKFHHKQDENTIQHYFKQYFDE